MEWTHKQKAEKAFKIIPLEVSNPPDGWGKIVKAEEEQEEEYINFEVINQPASYPQSTGVEEWFCCVLAPRVFLAGAVGVAVYYLGVLVLSIWPFLLAGTGVLATGWLVCKAMSGKGRNRKTGGNYTLPSTGGNTYIINHNHHYY